MAQRIAVVSLALALVAMAKAHTLPISFLRIVPDVDYAHLELTLNPFEFSFFSEIDRDHDGRLSSAELQAQEKKISSRILAGLELRVTDQIIAPETAGIHSDPESHHLTLRAHYPIDARHAPVQIASTLNSMTGGSHVTQVTFGRGTRIQAARLDMQTTQVTFAPAEPGRIADAPRPRQEWTVTSLLLLVSIPAMIIFGSTLFFVLHRPREDELAH